MAMDLFTRPKPSPEQAEFIENENRRLLGVAGPGTGKTFSMIERGNWLMDREGMEPGEVLYLTFTVKAADEIRERFADGNRQGVHAFTFHGFAYHLLRQYGERIHYGHGGLSWPFTVIDEVDQGELLAEIVDDYGWKKKLKPQELARYYDGGFREKDFPNLNGLDLGELETVLHEYERRKVDSNAVDFAGLLRLAHHVLSMDPDYNTLVADWFRAVFVDEFQDTDGLQYALVRRIIRPATWLTLVGDDDQSIYGWRDADPALMLGATVEVYGLPPGLHDAPGTISLAQWSTGAHPDVFDVKTLGVNRRSLRRIVDGAARFIRAATYQRMDKPFGSHRDGDGEVSVLAWGEGEERTHLPLLVNRHLAHGSVGVLTRTNAGAKALASYLRTGGLEVFVPGERSSTMESTDARAVLYFLRVLANRFDRWNLLRALWHMKGLRGITAELQTTVMGAQALLRAVRETQAPGSENREVLDLVAKLQDAEDGPQKLVDAVEFVRTVLGSWGETREAIRTWAGSWAGGGGNLASFLFYAAIYGENLEERESHEAGQVWVSTIHKAKGREFSAVVFSNFEDHTWPGKKDPDEDRRTAYVAMTRARDRLVFTWRRRGKVWGEWKDLRPSEWLGASFPDLLRVDPDTPVV